MGDQVRVIEAALLAADDALDRRLELALAEAERLSARIGRNPKSKTRRSTGSTERLLTARGVRPSASHLAEHEPPDP
jgi:hypothetical protein